MLLEAISYLSTPCPEPLRTMGYSKELIALAARFKRCRTAWRPHLERTKTIIIEATDATERREKAVILGPGILSDIPIEALAERFETVQLIDVCFLRGTLRRIRRFPNVHRTTMDITGIAKPLYAWMQGGRSRETFPLPVMPDAAALLDADLIVSANILSQLPLIPIAYASEHGGLADDDAAHDFARAIVRRHLSWLGTCPGTVCLISEVEQRFVNGNGVIGSDDPLWGEPLNIDGDTWDWEMAPIGEVSKDYAIRNQVIGAFWTGRGGATVPML